MLKTEWNRAQEPGVTAGCERAGPSLEGGFTHFLEGLGDSRIPCARTLSVAGFFAILSLFPARERFIPEGRKGFFLSGRSPFFNIRTKSVK